VPARPQPNPSPVDPAGGGDVRVLVVADDPLARAGLRTLVEGFDGSTIVGQVAPESNLENDLEAYAPDIVVWDLGWDAEVGLEQLTDLDWAELPLIVLLADNTLAAAVWRAGARGLLPRTVSGEGLAAGMAAVLEGLAAVDPELLASLLPDEPVVSGLLVEPLTAREMDVLRLMADGLPNKAIAVRLDISEFTVKFHVNAILGKLGARSRTEAAMTAARMGLVPL
jgi:two-component system nitrate/nitrite response regulator NarL